MIEMWDFLRYLVDHGDGGTFIVCLVLISSIASVMVAFFRAIGSFFKRN